MERLKIFLNRSSDPRPVGSDEGLATTILLDPHENNLSSPDMEAGNHTSTQGSSSSQDEHTGSGSTLDTIIAAQSSETPRSNTETSTCDPTASVAASSPSICPNCALSLPGPPRSFVAIDERLEVSLDEIPVTPNLQNIQASTPLVSASPSTGLPVPTASVRESTTLQTPRWSVPVEPAQHLVPPVTTLAPPAPSALPVPTSLGSQKEDPFGIKALAEGADAKVDLVAVHGLDGHWEDSWTAGNGILWLRDLLPEAVANLRILTWGYDGRTHGHTPLSCQSLHDHALALITDLTIYRRRTTTQERPIIFIAHGVGGIIIKDALIHSNSANPSNLGHHNAIKISTYGVLFFGTPHQGTENASWSQLLFSTTSLMNRRNKALLSDLEEHSASLQKQLAQYNHISSDFETKFFYETYAPVGEHIVVPAGAAVVPGATNAESFSINSDHTGLVKYHATTDAGFKKVSLCISLMVDEAPIKAEHRWGRQRLISAAEKNEGVVLSFDIPFQLEHLRNPRFTGRPSLLASIQDAIKANSESGRSTPIVLYGTGGIGKSQVVVEYLYAHQKDHPSIFWINSATPEMIVLGFRAAAQRLIKQHAKLSFKCSPHYPTIAKSLGMAGAVDERGFLFPGADYNKSIINGVKLWLSNEQNRNWLLVFDNVDDLETLNIETYMPSPATGAIIMTSRRPECAHFGVGLEVNSMQESEAVALLLRTARLSVNVESLEDSPHALDLVEKLGYLPLALAQAGAYIATHKTPLKEYLAIYQESFKRSFDKTPPSGSWTYKDRSILTTWEISFRAVREVNNGAAELLSLCAFVFNEIDLGMLHRGGIVEASDQCLDLLYSYSLAHPRRTSSSFYIHPVVHRWARERLNSSQRVLKTQKAMNLVTSGLDRWKSRTIERCQYEREIMMHIDSVTQNVQLYLSTEIQFKSVGYSLTTLYEVHYEWGKYSEAEWFARKMCELEQSLGDDSKSVGSMLLLAATYSGQDRHDEAGCMGLQALEMAKRNLGPKDPLTLSAMGNLAGTYLNQSRFDEAERLLLQVLEERKRTLGPEHPRTLHTMDNLSDTYLRTNRLEEAERLQLQVLETRKKTLEPEHPDILHCISKLEGINRQKSGLEEPDVPLLQQLLEARKRTLGPKHPQTLHTMRQLSCGYFLTDRFDEAERLGLQVLESNKRRLGPEHPETLDVMGTLSALYTRTDRLEEAERLQLQVLEATKRTLGPKHPSTVSVMNLLAITYKGQHRFDEAERLERQALDDAKDLGLGNPIKLALMVAQSATYLSQDRFSEAYELISKVVYESECTHGRDHPETIQYKHLADLCPRGPELPSGRITEEEASRLAEDKSEENSDPLELMAAAAELHQGQTKDAEGLLQQVMRGKELSLGVEHPDTLLAMGNLASNYCTQKRWDEAENLQQLVIDTRQRVLGHEHTDTLSAMVSLASTYWNQGEWEKAEILEKQVVDVRQRVLGTEHPDTISAMTSLAVSYRMQGQYKEAEELQRRVVYATERLRGSEHPHTMTAMSNLASAYVSQERWEEAEELQEIIVDTRQKKLRKNHPDTQRAMINLAFTYRKRGRHEEASNLQSKRVKLSQPNSSYDHPSTLDEMRDLINDYMSQGRMDDLQVLLIEMSERLGEEDKMTLVLKGIISKVYKSSGRYDEASILREQVIEVFQRRGTDPESLLQLAESM